MGRPGEWAVDSHPRRAEILEAMATGMTNIDIHRNIAPDISRHGLGNYRRKIFRPAATIALQLAENKSLKEISGSSTNVQDRATAQVSAAAPLLATMRKEAEQRNRWIGCAEDDPEGMNHQALYGHDRNRLQEHRLHAELVGALTKETAGPVTNIMIVAAAPGQAEPPIDVIDGEIIDVGASSPQDE